MSTCPVCGNALAHQIDCWVGAEAEAVHEENAPVREAMVYIMEMMK